MILDGDSHDPNTSDLEAMILHSVPAPPHPSSSKSSIYSTDDNDTTASPTPEKPEAPHDITPESTPEALVTKSTLPQQPGAPSAPSTFASHFKRYSTLSFYRQVTLGDIPERKSSWKSRGMKYGGASKGGSLGS